MTVAPGVAFWATPQFSLGARMPLQFMTMGSDAAQVSLEPYLRFDVSEQRFCPRASRCAWTTCWVSPSMTEVSGASTSPSAAASSWQLSKALDETFVLLR